MIEEAARFRVQCRDRSHILRADLEIENVEIFLYPLLANRFRDCHHAALGQPAQDDLRN